MTTYEQMIEATRATLAQRDSRRDILAERIRATVEPALEAARRRSIRLGDAGILAYRTPVADCSQWSNRIDCPDHEGEPCLMLWADGWRSLGPAPDVGFSDGSNMQYQCGPTRELETDERIRPATVAQLRAVARALPESLTRMIETTRERAQEETEIADTALEEMPS